MVNIVTGGIDKGKTTKLLSLYKEKKAGDGFVIKKLRINGEYAGQMIVRLSTGDKVCFSLIDGFVQRGWNEVCRFGPYSFSKEGFDFASSIVADIIKYHINPVFIDEIGPLELEEKGFFLLFTLLLNENKEIFTAIREYVVDSVISKFKITNYNLINI